MDSFFEQYLNGVIALLERIREEEAEAVKEAARLLGLTTRVMNYKIKSFNITHPRWRRNR